MKVFISWSGNRSRAVADLLDEWIQCVLQAIRPWMSSKDIDRGSLWFSEISDQLADTKIGIVCLTKENLNRPWILFESGALAKGLTSSRVCTFLIDLEPADVGNPLAQFNHTAPDKDSMFELVRTLNSSLGDKALKDKVVEQVFETYWPQFQSSFNQALADNPTDVVDAPRSEESMMHEVLSTVRAMDRRLRLLEKTDGKFGNPSVSSSNKAEFSKVLEFLMADGVKVKSRPIGLLAQAIEEEEIRKAKEQDASDDDDS